MFSAELIFLGFIVCFVFLGGIFAFGMLFLRLFEYILQSKAMNKGFKIW